jgi:curli biogenesis system outer membrane secretion channel CsgG
MRGPPLILAAIVAAALVAPSPVSAKVASLTHAQAVRAVEREVKAEYNMSYPDVTCKKLTAKRQKCRFHGLARDDVRDNNVGGHSGTAYVTRLRYGTDVRVTSYHKGF